MTSNALMRQQIIEAFGTDAYLDYRSSNTNDKASHSTPEYQINRKYLASKVFGDDKKLAQLNAIVHPIVAKDALEWHQNQINCPYTLYEAAITFETGGNKVLDKIIVVSAPVDTRLQRVMQRDQVTAEQVEARMKKQWPEEKKKQLADFIIENDGQSLLIPQVLKVHQELLKQ